MQNNYTVINASAGSGKTYNLVQRLLLICLRFPNQHSEINHILALTFTNKAANEMKERILSWLSDFSADDYAQNVDLVNIQKKLEEEGHKVDLEELHKRSKKLLDYILHHYSRLNIGTIDKFNARLVRSFSYELGLAKNFNLEINAEPFLIEAVDKMLDQIGENKEVTETMLNFVNYRLDNEERINLNSSLYHTAKEFVKDIHYERLKNNAGFTDENYQKATQSLRQKIKNLQQDSLKIAQEALQLIKSRGIEKGDFAGGASQGIQHFFEKYINEGSVMLYDSVDAEERKLANYRKGASSQKASKAKEGVIFEIIENLIDSRGKIISNYVEETKSQKILDALLPLKVNQDIQNELALIEQENDVVLLSKFNVLINENLREEPSEFIYEKVGAQFQHFFFDEFQDTSALQWQNFVPLRDHSVSTADTSFTLVGDPKQSIYRFRGGDSQLMLDILQHKEKSPKVAEIITLKENWRSAQNIVEFNNQLYQYLSQELREEHRDIFGENAQQLAMSSAIGRVRVNLIENQLKEDFYDDTAHKMQQNIQQCLDNGFRFSDITILCRGNNDIFKFSQKLNALQVDYHGQKTYIKTISEKGLTLELSNTLNAVVEFLRWETHPKNNQYFAMMMYYLQELERIEMADFTGDILQILACENRTEMIEMVKSRYDVDLGPSTFPKLNLYHFIEHYLKEFAVEEKETDFLLNFLETLYGYTQNAGSTIKDFLQFWDEEARKQTIQASENVDAIELMTIHKAKGLEFPVVFLPMENTHSDYKFNEWFDTENEFGLEAVSVNQFKVDLAVYDPEIEEFNEQNSYKNQIDRLCVQYVATTRPVEQLFLYLQRPAKENKIKIFDFVQQHNPKNLDEFDIFKVEDEQDLKKKSKEKTKDYQTQSITKFAHQSENSGHIKIATPSKNYQNRNEKVRQGIFVHDLLSEINSKKDVDKVLEKHLLKGLITTEEKEVLSAKILEIIEKYPLYFGEDLDLVNEKDIMISVDGESRLYRPDRLINTENGYWIVDFKTGEERKKDRDQIAHYQSILEKLGKKVLGTELIYI